MTPRYNAKDTVRALKFLGFNVRDPNGATSVFCIHGLTKEEVWIPKIDNGFLEDVLESIFKPTNLEFSYFKSGYMNLPKNNTYPSDEH